MTMTTTKTKKKTTRKKKKTTTNDNNDAITEANRNQHPNKKGSSIQVLQQVILLLDVFIFLEQQAGSSGKRIQCWATVTIPEKDCNGIHHSNDKYKGWVFKWDRNHNRHMRQKWLRSDLLAGLAWAEAHPTLNPMGVVRQQKKEARASKRWDKLSQEKVEERLRETNADKRIKIVEYNERVNEAADLTMKLAELKKMIRK